MRPGVKQYHRRNGWLQRRAGNGWWLVWLVGLLLAGWGVWRLATSNQLNPQTPAVDYVPSDEEVTPAQEAVLVWMSRDYPVDWGTARVVFGPSKSLPLWKFPRHFSFEQIPSEVDNWETMQDYLWQTQPHYLIIDSDTVHQRRSALNKYFAFDGQGIDFEQLPAGWTLAYLYNSPGSPYAWSIFTPFRQPRQVVTANFGDQIELVGYDMVRDEKARTAHVALYWRAKGPISNDYTSYLYLTTPDGFVKAGQERLPFDGQWPTPRWRAGDVLVDRFEIPLNDGITPGDYLLLTGFYDPDSGVPLSLLEGPASPVPNAALLDHIALDKTF